MPTEVYFERKRKAVETQGRGTGLNLLKTVSSAIKARVYQNGRLP